MSDHTDESQDWPLRDYSTRLRPPGRIEHEPPDEPKPLQEPEQPDERLAGGAQEEAAQHPGSTSATEPEILYEEPAVQPEPEPEPPAAEPEEQHAAGDFRVPGGYAVLEGEPTGQRRSVAIVVSRFNGEITHRLLQSALTELEDAGVDQDAVLVMPVPGAFELPIAAMALAKTRRYACVIALGCVIRGETPHFDFVASEAASGLQLAGIETGVPVSFGVLTCDTAEQAEARADRGAVAARSALEMADAFSQLRTTAAARG
jgi:6,7-dimethyl-8-ribityllumazine synthase